jgi:hypothetical protein
VGGADDLTLWATASAEPVEVGLRRREQLTELIHNLRVRAPLLYHRVLQDGGPGAVEFDDGCELVLAGYLGRSSFG